MAVPIGATLFGRRAEMFKYKNCSRPPGPKKQEHLDSHSYDLFVKVYYASKTKRADITA